MNKFERARLISSRAFEISKGDKPKVKLSKGMKLLTTTDFVKVAEMELDQGKLDLEIYK